MYHFVSLESTFGNGRKKRRTVGSQIEIGFVQKQKKKKKKERKKNWTLLKARSQFQLSTSPDNEENINQTRVQVNSKPPPPPPKKKGKTKKDPKSTGPIYRYEILETKKTISVKRDNSCGKGKKKKRKKRGHYDGTRGVGGAASELFEHRPRSRKWKDRWNGFRISSGPIEALWRIPPSIMALRCEEKTGRRPLFCFVIYFW